MTTAVKMNTAKDYTINAEIAETAVVDNHADVATLASAAMLVEVNISHWIGSCLLYTSPSPRDLSTSRMPSSA